jgi:hypothetical protein
MASPGTLSMRMCPPVSRPISSDSRRFSWPTTLAENASATAPTMRWASAMSPRSGCSRRIAVINASRPGLCRRGLRAWDTPARAFAHGCQANLTSSNIDIVADPEELSAAIGGVSSADPAIGLRAVHALQRLQERLEAIHVANAREQGWSWQAIAEALGVSRQAVHQKYNRRR